jgi:hypothetical protein
LRLASPGLSGAKLEQFLHYQRRLAKALGLAVANASDDAFARAHEVARAESGLEVHELELIRKAVRRFAGNRATAARLAERRKELQSTDAELLEKLDEKLAQLDKDLGRSGDAQTVAELLARQEEILALHAALGRFG